MNTLIHLPPTLTFDFESYLSESLGLDIYKKRTPVSATSAPQQVCKYFLKGTCHRGENCSYFHPKDGRTVVCKHYLRGLCSKGERCEFLHEVFESLDSLQKV